jgi:hypothetical protein
MSRTFLNLYTITYEFAQLRKNICLPIKGVVQKVTDVVDCMELVRLFMRNCETELHWNL